MKSTPVSIIFEHPLNEKMRSWLRIEYLLQHLFSSNESVNKSQTLFFLHNLSHLLEILDRNDSRVDLIKDLGRQQQKLLAWADIPGVDMIRLTKLKQQLENCITMLKANPRLGQSLREDPLISAIRQRLITPGGGYSFDLPILHFWLHYPKAEQRKQIACWLTAIDPLHSALKLQLNLLRQSMPFQQQQAIHGFYKGKTEEGDLLRIRLAQQQNTFPQISAHKNCFAIRFLPYLPGLEKIPVTLPFELVCC